MHIYLLNIITIISDKSCKYSIAYFLEIINFKGANITFVFVYCLCRFWYVVVCRMSVCVTSRFM